MPKFKVHIQQYVEMLTTVEVEATDENEARIWAMGTDPGITAEWGKGDDCYSADAYAVEDKDGIIVWER